MPKIFDSSSSAIGAVQPAMVTEAQFQAQFGAGWVLADGRSVVGTKYASITGNTTIPDLRGIYLRGKNNGRADGNQNPAADRALGFFENDQMQGHIHGTNIYNDNTGGSGTSFGQQQNDNVGQIYSGTPYTDGVNGVPRTGSETRVKNVTVNYFIRIN